MSRRAAAGQAAASDVAGPTRERATNRPDPGVSTAGGPHSADTPECPPVAGEAEGCHYHGVFSNQPLEPDPSRRLANLVASHSRDSSSLALLPLWPRRRPLLFLRPRLLQLPLSRPSLLLLSPEAGLLCPWLLWPHLLRQ
ncbi:hypothetical protein MRX96_037169 [Rhipicephalus microplus]